MNLGEATERSCTASKRIWITEYGYRTNPPDRLFGVSYAKQAAYLTHQAFLRDRARKNPRVDMMLWFLLKDEQSLAGWQSSLITFGRKHKPAFNAFLKMAAAGWTRRKAAVGLQPSVEKSEAVGCQPKNDSRSTQLDVRPGITDVPGARRGELASRRAARVSGRSHPGYVVPRIARGAATATLKRSRPLSPAAAAARIVQRRRRSETPVKSRDCSPIPVDPHRLAGGDRRDEEETGIYRHAY